MSEKTASQGARKGRRPSRVKSSKKALAAARYQVVRADETFEFGSQLPCLPLRDVVVFPYMTIPLLVGRPASVRAIERAVAADRTAVVVTQKRSEVADPEPGDLYGVGTVVRLLQLFRLPDGTLRVLVEGIARARVRSLEWVGDSYDAAIDLVPEDTQGSAETEALQRNVLTSFTDYVRLNRRIPDE